MASRRRIVFAELVEGLDAMREYREGKRTLRPQTRQKRMPTVDARTIRETRERLKMSQRLFAETLRINPRTLERWEQGRSKPNEQAAVLILLLRRHPETIDQIAGCMGAK